MNWLWTGVVVIVVVVGIIGFVLWQRKRNEQLEARRSDAAQLRERAQARAEAAEQREAQARRQTELAERERAGATAAARRADELDPDVPDQD